MTLLVFRFKPKVGFQTLQRKYFSVCLIYRVVILCFRATHMSFYKHIHVDGSGTTRRRQLATRYNSPSPTCRQQAANKHVTRQLVTELQTFLNIKPFRLEINFVVSLLLDHLLETAEQ